MYPQQPLIKIQYCHQLIIIALNFAAYQNNICNSVTFASRLNKLHFEWIEKKEKKDDSISHDSVNFIELWNVLESWLFSRVFYFYFHCFYFIAWSFSRCEKRKKCGCQRPAQVAVGKGKHARWISTSCRVLDMKILLTASKEIPHLQPDSPS